MEHEYKNLERIRAIAYRAGVSEEDVEWLESLCDREPELEIPDVLLENIEEA